MKLWVDGKTGDAGQAVRAIVKDQVAEINRKVISRGMRAVNALQTAEKEVLSKQGTGRIYKKPGTYGKRPTKATRKLLGDYGHKLKGGQLYRASAPGEAPARRTGNLRLHWNGEIKSERSSGGVAILAVLESGERYAAALENGTPKMAARPFMEKIKAEAMPEIQKIYSEPYA